MNNSNDVSRKNSFRRPLHGFTLVELLVVVAIIALLVSILLPSLGKAKEQARMVMCMSNLKSLGMGYNLYTFENDDWYPQSCGNGGYPPSWDFILVSYYGNRDVLHCPSDPPNGDPACGYSRSTLWDDYRGTPTEDRFARSYAMNANVCGQGPSEYNPDYWPGDVHKTTHVVAPSETLLLSETWYWSYYPDSDITANLYNDYAGSHTTAGGLFDPGRCRGPTDSVHRNKDVANYLFSDSHVLMLSADNPKLIEPDDYYFKIDKD